MAATGHRFRDHGQPADCLITWARSRGRRDLGPAPAVPEMGDSRSDQVTAEARRSLDVDLDAQTSARGTAPGYSTSTWASPAWMCEVWNAACGRSQRRGRHQLRHARMGQRCTLRSRGLARHRLGIRVRPLGSGCARSITSIARSTPNARHRRRERAVAIGGSWAADPNFSQDHGHRARKRVFQPASIRRTSKRWAQTEASSRFERGGDVNARQPHRACGGILKRLGRHKGRSAHRSVSPARQPLQLGWRIPHRARVGQNIPSATFRDSSSRSASPSRSARVPRRAGQLRYRASGSTCARRRLD